MTPVEVSDEALADLMDLVDWYVTEDAVHAANWLHDEWAQTLARLAASPGLGTPAGHGTRTWPLHRFPVSVVYRLGPSGVRVIAVAGQRRRPGYWVGRR